MISCVSAIVGRFTSFVAGDGRKDCQAQTTVRAAGLAACCACSRDRLINPLPGGAEDPQGKNLGTIYLENWSVFRELEH